MPKQKSRLGRLIRCRPTLFIGDVVRNAISRIGVAGLILIVSMVIFAFLAGGVVVHRLGTSQTATVEQPDKQDDQGAKNHGQSKPKHTNNGHGNANKSNDSDENEND